MSLKNGSRKHMPLWSCVAVLLFAVVVLPGAVVGQPAEEQLKTAEAWEPVEAGSDGTPALSDTRHGDEIRDATVEYPVGELVAKLAETQSLTRPAARQLLAAVLGRAAGAVGEDMEAPPRFRMHSADGKVTICFSSMGGWDDDTLAVTHSRAGHEKIGKRLEQFRNYGFAEVLITATVFTGPPEVIDPRARIYSPRVKPRTVIRETVDDLVERLFAGEAMPLVRHLVEEKTFSPEELAQLRELLLRLEGDSNDH